MKRISLKYKMGILACTLFLAGGVVCGATNNEVQSKNIILETDVLQDRIAAFEEALTVTKDGLSKFDVTSYVDGEGNLYEFSEEGYVSGYMKADYKMDNSAIISKSQAIEVANACLKSYTKGDNYAVVSVDYDSSLEYYRVVYSYYIGEYATTDGMYFDISADGEVIDFEARNTGKFAGVELQVKEKGDVLDSARKKIAAENQKCSNIIISKIMIGCDDKGFFYSAGALGVDTITGESKELSTVIRIEQ